MQVTQEDRAGHADRTGIGPVLARLTAAGGEFELEQETVRGHVLRIYRRGPHTLRELLAGTTAVADRTFLVYERERWTYGEHLRVVAGLARWMRDDLGLRRGDRVAIAMRNYPEWSPVFWAALVAGCVAVPLNAWWTADRLAWAVADSGSALIVADGERVDLLAGRELPPVVRVRGEGPVPAGVRDWADVVAGLDRDPTLPDVDVLPDDDATIIYTSGTTGRPKGSVSTHRNHCTNALNVLLQARATAALTQAGPPAGQPGTLIAYPLFHMAGVNALYGAVLNGAKAATLYRWDAGRALELVRRERLTGTAGVPTVIAELVERACADPDAAASLTRFGMGGAPIPASLVTRIATSLRGAYAGNGFGSTETTSAVCLNGGADYVAHPDSVGRLVPGADLRIRDLATGAALPEEQVGELCFRGPNIFRGYWNDPEATTAAFDGEWFQSGDLGYRRDGWVYVVDRLKDVVVRGGENVYCVEIEAALLAHPGVAEAAVIGAPHPTLGEEVVAVVRTAPGSEPDTEALRRHLATLLPAYAVPSRILWRSGELPRTATGKILKGVLRDGQC